MLELGSTHDEGREGVRLVCRAVVGHDREVMQFAESALSSAGIPIGVLSG